MRRENERPLAIVAWLAREAAAFHTAIRRVLNQLCYKYYLLVYIFINKSK